MNLQSKTQTEINPPGFDPSKLATTKDYPLHKAIADSLKADQKSYSNDSSTFPTAPYVVNNFSKAEESKMNENDMLKTYMEKVDRDQSDLRADIRASERRTSEKIDKMEERMDQRLNRIEDMIQSYTKETADSIDKLNEKVDSKLRWVEGTCVATILGIAAIVITVIVSTFAG